MTGLSIDITLSDDWKIFFNQGTDGKTAIRTIESFILNLKDYKDYPPGSTWDIRYDHGVFIVPQPSDGCEIGTSIGGFIVRDCNINILQPQNDCMVYNRIFTDEFSNEYNKINTIFNDCTGEFKPSQFNQAFN